MSTPSSITESEMDCDSSSTLESNETISSEFEETQESSSAFTASQYDETVSSNVSDSSHDAESDYLNLKSDSDIWSYCSESDYSDDTCSSDSEMQDNSTSTPTKSPNFPGLPSEFLHPLYDGADLNVIDSYLLLLQYSLRHSLTKKAFSELIQLVSVHLPSASKSAESLHKLKGIFIKLFDDIKSVSCKYCSKCHRLLESTTTVCPSGCCVSIDEFLHIPLKPQLRRKIEDPHVWKLLKQRFNGRSSDIIRDIYDGHEYKRHSALLSSTPANVSLLCNTDGIAIFKSSKFSLWPVWVVINELPPTERFSRRNIMLAGLWFAKTKPTMTTYIMPLIMSINELYEKGIEINSPDGPIISKAILLLCSVDLPAQAALMNMKQYNGAYGCPYCEQEGSPRPTNSLHRNWPKKDEPLRSHQSMLDNAKETIAMNSSVKGVKGASVFCLHKPFDLSKGFAIDDLHTIYLGIVLDLLKFWFGANHKEKPYNIRSKIKVCDEKLLSIHVPDIISRTPKSLHDFKKWKGSELRSWLLFYSIPILSDALPQVYLSHYALLVSSVHILLSDAITSSDLDNVHFFLERFYEQYVQLYGDNSATMKLHLLSHLTMCVRNWGPLWAYSCFSFEGHNHLLKILFHGTHQMNKQLAFSHTMLQVIPAAVALRSVYTKDRVQLMLETLTGNKRLACHQLPGQQCCYVLGRATNVTLPTSHYTLLNAKLQALCLQPIKIEQEVMKFHRIMKENSVFFSAGYSRVRVRNSYTVEYVDDDDIKIGKILYYVHVITVTFAVIRELLPVFGVSNYFNLSNDSLDCLHCSRILPISSEESISFVPVKDITKKIVFMNFGTKMYIATFPNNLTHD